MQLTATSHSLPRTPDRPSEDACALHARGDTFVTALADGVGSAAEGREAAERAVRTLTDNYLARPRAWTPSRALREFAEQLNARLHAESMARHERPEMLTTLAAVAIERGVLCGLNLGDSPVFVSRRGQLRRLSVDHAHTEENLRHVLTRALGMEPTVVPHEFAWVLEPGDVVLLCSDGVANLLDEPRLAALLARRATARILVGEAAERATPETADDLTAIVVEVAALGPDRPESAPPALDVAEHAAPGDAIDGWILERELQTGGRVWLAHDAGGARAVLKLPPREARGDESIAHAFIREAWHAVRLGGGAFPLAWMPEGPALRWYAMEFIDAPTLHTLVASRPLGVEDAVALGRFLLGAVATLLRHDLVHGDLKPENILVLRRPDGSPDFRLLDLGSACTVFTAAGRAGTPTFLAPERFTGAPLTERTELYSIGATLYFAVTGSYPYGEIERFQTPHFEAAPKTPARLNPAIPLWLDAVLRRAVAADPLERQQAYSEMLFELEHPEQVQPFHPRNAPLLERNPLGFYRAALLLSLLLNLVLLARCSSR